MRKVLVKRFAAAAVMVLALSALFVLAGCGAEGGDAAKDKAADAGAYEIGFRCTVDPQDATVLMDRLNEYRVEQGAQPLKWNSDPEEELLTRAAELAICYSDVRLDGEPGQELQRGCFEGPENWAEELLADEDFCAKLCDPEKTSLCIGIIESWNGGCFGALDLYPKAGETEAAADGPGWKKDEEKVFRLKAKDQQLNLRAELMDEEMEPVGAGDLYAGESYYFVIINSDPNNSDYEEELDAGYCSSDDPETVAIDEYGAVTAKKAGTTTIEVRPAENSGIHLSLEVTVQ